MNRYLLLVLLVLPRAAWAGDRAAAEALFRDGRRLLDAGNVGAACEKFAESQRLDAQPGTLINLAICHETEGRIASAWSEYLEAATQAARSGQTKREQFAREHARDLEGRLPMLTIEVTSRDTEVRVNGKARGPSTFGVALPIDPGDVVIEATAPQRKPWSTRLTIAPGPEKTVVVPELEASSGPVPAPTSSPSPSPAPAPLPTKVIFAVKPGAAQRTAGYITMAAGGVGLLVGGGTGLWALSQKSSLEEDPGCPGACGSAEDVKSYNRTRIVSGVSFIAGAVLLVTGAVLVLTAPRKTTVTPAGLAGAFR